MALPYWYEKGREFALGVLDGLQDAGMFRPENSMQEWFDFNAGSGFESDDLMDMAHWALTVPAARHEFASGYRDAMRETRFNRHMAKRKAQ